MERKSLIKEYENWCLKHKKDPQSLDSLDEFKQFKKEQEEKKVAQSKADKKKALVEKQKEIFKAMCEYVGVNVEYDEDEERDLFGCMDDVINSLVKAVAVAQIKKKVAKALMEEEE